MLALADARVAVSFDGKAVAFLDRAKLPKAAAPLANGPCDVLVAAAAAGEHRVTVGLPAGAAPDAFTLVSHLLHW